MVICGIKLTHDAAICLIDNDRLVFCYEIEKLNNNERYATLNSLSILDDIFKEHGYTEKDIDKIVIDGWGEFTENMSSSNKDGLYRMTIKDKYNRDVLVELNSYGYSVKDESLLNKLTFNYPANDLSYNSYLHVSGHVMSAYCTSPFARKNEASFVLVWDGGMCPQLFYMKGKEIENLGPIFYLAGSSYSVFASNYKPFNHLSMDNLSIAGKLMAYIALGECSPAMLAEFREMFKRQEEIYLAKYGTDMNAQAIKDFTFEFLMKLIECGEIKNIKPVDMMATFHYFIQDLLVEKLSAAVSRYPGYTKNLCFAGGCALNIKWNSNIRNSGLFTDMWVPPFPNDSGSAIGVACCEMINSNDKFALDWNVYKGPQIYKGKTDEYAWDKFDCPVKELALLLHSQDEPVVFLNGRAELGPRALGNRSILAAAVNPSMKSVLNKVKGREDYRPVAPICIEEDAPQIFLPGSPDPLMLFDHTVKEEWKNKIPAICHLDGSARLQTIGKNDNPVIYELLQAYKELSGVPLLCNTSANLNGKGFFPDVASAMKWGQVNMIWSEGELFIKPGSDVYRKYMALKAMA